MFRIAIKYPGNLKFLCSLSLNPLPIVQGFPMAILDSRRGRKGNGPSSAINSAVFLVDEGSRAKTSHDVFLMLCTFAKQTFNHCMWSCSIYLPLHSPCSWNFLWLICSFDQAIIRNVAVSCHNVLTWQHFRTFAIYFCEAAIANCISTDNRRTV